MTMKSVSAGRPGLLSLTAAGIVAVVVRSLVMRKPRMNKIGRGDAAIERNFAVNARKHFRALAGHVELFPKIVAARVPKLSAGRPDAEQQPGRQRRRQREIRHPGRCAIRFSHRSRAINPARCPARPRGPNDNRNQRRMKMMPRINIPLRELVQAQQHENRQSHRQPARRKQGRKTERQHHAQRSTASFAQSTNRQATTRAA